MDKRTENGLYLFKSLIKDGCEYQGDIISKTWSEHLHIPATIPYGIGRIKQTLADYEEGVDYRLEGEKSIWIA